MHPKAPKRSIFFRPKLNWRRSWFTGGWCAPYRGKWIGLVLAYHRRTSWFEGWDWQASFDRAAGWTDLGEDDVLEAMCRAERWAAGDQGALTSPPSGEPRPLKPFQRIPTRQEEADWARRLVKDPNAPLFEPQDTTAS